jgi:uncharacterized protein
VDRHVLIVFLKAPTPGRVKTRLAADLGDDRAAAIYRELIAETFQHLPWDMLDVWLCYDPPEAESEIRAWLTPTLPKVVTFLPQAAGDLGARLDAASRAAFAAGATTVTMIGTDCPEFRFPVFVILRRFLAEPIDCVFGPAADGGYYLVALKRPCSEIFTDIPWSTDQTLSASLAAAGRAKLRTHLLTRTLRDIDTLADFTAWDEARKAPAAGPPP